MLTDDIVRLEAEADAAIARAHGEAKRIELAAQEEAEARRRAVLEDTERRVADFRADAALGNARAMARAEEELRAALNALENIPEQTLRSCAAKIVERLETL